jgi:hypothetical protein
MMVFQAWDLAAKVTRSKIFRNPYHPGSIQAKGAARPLFFNLDAANSRNQSTEVPEFSFALAVLQLRHSNHYQDSAIYPILQG